MGFFSFSFFLFSLCFLEEKSVKILKYTLSSVQALSSQHCGYPGLQGEWQWTQFFRATGFFFPTKSCQGLPKVHHGILLSFHNVTTIPVCSDTWPFLTACEPVFLQEKHPRSRITSQWLDSYITKIINTYYL